MKPLRGPGLGCALALTLAVVAACAAPDPERQRVEVAAVQSMQAETPGMGVLQGNPRRLTAQRMSADEAMRRLLKRTPDCRGPDDPVWMVVVEGQFDESGLLPQQKDFNAEEGVAWVMLTPAGERVRWGKGRVELANKLTDAPADRPACPRG